MYISTVNQKIRAVRHLLTPGASENRKMTGALPPFLFQKEAMGAEVPSS